MVVSRRTVEMSMTSISKHFNPKHLLVINKIFTNESKSLSFLVKYLSNE